MENVIEMDRPKSISHVGMGTNINIKMPIIPTANAISPRHMDFAAPPAREEKLVDGRFEDGPAINSLFR